MSDALKIVAHRNGQQTDITDGVRALYDLVLNSVDWGSGFWTLEDAQPVAAVAEACGFENADEVRQYIGARTHEAESSAWLSTLPEMPGATFSWEEVLPHEHVFSSVGRCMWPRCREGRA